MSRECQCGPKALKDGSRCAKCGKPLPSKRRPRPPGLAVRGLEITEVAVDEYASLLERLERQSEAHG